MKTINSTLPRLVARNIQTGEEVKPGDVIKNFLGETVKFSRATRSNSPGRDGKIMVDGGVFEFYARVFGLMVTEE